RFQAAAALVQAGNRDAVPPLFALLADAPLPVAWQAEDLLCRLAEERAPRLTLGAGGKADRGKCRDAWEAWWKADGAKVDLARLSRTEPLLNLNLVSELDGSGPAGAGRVWEFGADGKSRWEISNLNRPIDARVLPGGRVLVAEHGAMRVTERD